MKLRALICLLLLVSNWASAQDLPRRPYMGINLQALNDSLQQRYRLPNKNGIFVRDVRAQSSALAAGLRAHDIILRVGTTDVGAEVGPFVALLKQYRTGDKVPFVVLRDGKKIRKQVTFMAFPKEQSPLYEAQYASVKVGSNHLRTIITKPRQARPGKLPMVLFIQGVGCFSVDTPLTPNEAVTRVIDSLSRHGYATLRVDKTGMGDSQGTPCLESDFETEANGYKAGLAAIRQLDFVDQQNIFVFGHSIGGIMAPVVAQGQNLKGIVVYGTASRNFIEYALQNKRSQSELQQLPYDSITDLMKTYTAALHLLLTEKQTPAQVLAKYPKAKRLISFPQHYTYMQQWQELNLAAAWQKVDTHVLALRGAADFISYNEDHQLIQDIVNREHPGYATFQVVPDVDHGFARAKTPAESMRLDSTPNPEKNFDFMRIVLNWLDTQRRA